MSAAVFLVGFLVLSAIGALVVWLRERRPRSWDSGMDEFSRTLRALSPENPIDPTPPGRTRGPSRSSDRDRSGRRRAG